MVEITNPDREMNTCTHILRRDNYVSLIACGLRINDNIIQGASSPTINNSFPDDKILTVSKLKVFADNKINVTSMIIYDFDRVEKHTGKRRKC